MMALLQRDGPFERRNTRLFVLFTTFYHARAYYPVLAILFTDLGLSIEQFVMLNVVWAVSILLFEVPSGALADTLGRKRLLVFSAALMVVELGVLLVAPKDGGWWLFGFCLVNRMLSGISEAAASGADEAITYDDLPEENRESAWDQVLVTAMRWRSVGFLISMSLGGLLYDPSWWNRWVPEAMEVSRDVAHRLPVVVVFLQGVVCLVVSLRFYEERIPSDEHPMVQCRKAWRKTLLTAKRAVTTRSIAMVLLGGLLIDAVARNMATLNSEYYRLIQIPEWSFGFMGSLIAVGNWFVPGIAFRVNQRLSPIGSLIAGGVVVVVAAVMLVPAWPWVGVLPVMMLMMMMGYVGFTISRFLHQVSESDQRATLLSVKGMIFNLSYGTYSLGFSLLLYGLAREGGGESLQRALFWQAGFFLLMLLGYVALTRILKSRLEPVVEE